MNGDKKKISIKPAMIDQRHSPKASTDPQKEVMWAQQLDNQIKQPEYSPTGGFLSGRNHIINEETYHNQTECRHRQMRAANPALTQ